MFGDFFVSYKEKIIISDNNRNNKVIEFFQFLLLRQDRAVRQDDLINTLLSGDEYKDPYHALKNLAYRLRKFLIASGLPENDYIRFQKGAYYMADIDYALDTAQFESAVKRAFEVNCSQENKLKFCMEAIAQYSGEFLPRSSNTLWVTPRAVRFKEMYLQCVKTAYDILLEEKDLSSILDLLEKALAIYPFEEDLRILYIYCLFALNRTREALCEYESASALLFDEMNLGPSDKMLELYKKITEAMSPQSASIEEIRNGMIESTEENGAYYCNYQAFTDAYRFAVRQAERSGQSAFLLLITKYENKNMDQSAKNVRQKITGAIHHAIKTSLRRGDLYTRYSSAQFVVLLTNIKQENCRTVSNRIAESFYKQLRGKPVKLSFKSITAIDIERIIKDE